jgi:hypothetical protein
MHHVIFKQNISELLLQFKTDVNAGLSNELAASQYTAFGANKIAGTATRKWWRIVLAQFNNLLVILLIIAGSLSFQLGSYRDGIVLAIIVVVITERPGRNPPPIRITRRTGMAGIKGGFETIPVILGHFCLVYAMVEGN